MQTCDLIIDNVQLATMAETDDYGLVHNQLMAVDNGTIQYIGPAAQCPFEARERIDARGGCVLPGFIDCHTHLVFGGDRADEFEMRLNGVSYADIAKRGGGIRSTVQQTRDASASDLLASAKLRARQLLKEGVTTVEIKSGYGLDMDTEIKMLEVARALSAEIGIQVSTTFLGAHAVPPEFSDNADGYIGFVCDQVMPVVAEKGLADAVDVFCEHIGFSPEQTRRVFDKASALSLPVKAHVEQLSDLKGAVLASEFNAMSVDHIEYLDPADVPALKRADTVAVLLPGAFYFLNETRKPPIDALRKQGVPMAVATDLNPGSSPMASLLLAINMACVKFALTPLEALQGVTRYAAKALKLENKGQLAVGMDADFCLWPVSHPNQLVYGINLHSPSGIWIRGERVSV